MPMFLKQLFEQATSQGYRSNVLKPLYGLLAIFLVASCVFFYIGITVFGYIVGSIGILIGIACAYSYFYCLYKDPNLLRSEKYNIERSVLEKVAVVGSSENQSAKIVLPQTEYIKLEDLKHKRENENL